MPRTVQYVFRGVIFEWDIDKADSNLSKHGVRFEVACEVFFDPFVRVTDATEANETRDAAIGYTESQSLMHVIHVVRHEEVIRIVSARRASQEERRLYEQL